MKRILLALTFTISLFTTDLFAQRGVPAQFRPAYNTMMANQSRQFMNSQMQMRLQNMNYWYGADDRVNLKYNYVVLMKDSTMRQVKSRIYFDTVIHKSYITYDDKTIKGDKKAREKKIYCTETITIGRDSYYESALGRANDSCWLFKVINGKINAYSPFSESNNLNNVRINAYQIANGQILKLDSAALAPIVVKSPKALKAFEKKDYVKAIEKYNADKETK